MAVILLPILVSAQDIDKEQVAWDAYFQKIQAADSLYNQKKYAAAAKTYSAAFTFNNQHFSSGHRYQAARAWARIGKKDSAFSNLDRELASDFHDYNGILSDPAFASLRGRPGWNHYITKLKAHKKADDEKLGVYKDVRPKLEEMMDLDQRYRLDYPAILNRYGVHSTQFKDLVRKMAVQDQLNQEFVCSILDKYGWVGYGTIGFKANKTLFLVIQHADSATQEKYLPMLQQAVAHKNAFGEDLALLTDRVYTNRGEKQVYGSQVKCDDNGKNCVVFPIADEKNVDKRRAEVGLQPLAEYLKFWNIVYKKPD